MNIFILDPICGTLGDHCGLTPVDPSKYRACCDDFKCRRYNDSGLGTCVKMHPAGSINFRSIFSLIKSYDIFQFKEHSWIILFWSFFISKQYLHGIALAAMIIKKNCCMRRKTILGECIKVTSIPIVKTVKENVNKMINVLGLNAIQNLSLIYKEDKETCFPAYGEGKDWAMNVYIQMKDILHVGKTTMVVLIVHHKRV